MFTLGADDAITRGLRRAGLKTIGDVASRERHEITARFGAAFTALLEQALGQGDAHGAAPHAGAAPRASGASETPSAGPP